MIVEVRCLPSVNLWICQNGLQFDNKFCVRDEGIAMGNPLSSFTVNSFYEFVWEKNAKSSKNTFRENGCMVDIFTIYDQNGNIEEFCNRINGFYPTIKITTELENDLLILAVFK